MEIIKNVANLGSYSLLIYVGYLFVKEAINMKKGGK